MLIHFIIPAKFYHPVPLRQGNFIDLWINIYAYSRFFLQPLIYTFTPQYIRCTTTLSRSRFIGRKLLISLPRKMLTANVTNAVHNEILSAICSLYHIRNFLPTKKNGASGAAIIKTSTTIYKSNSPLVPHIQYMPE